MFASLSANPYLWCVWRWEGGRQDIYTDTHACCHVAQRLELMTKAWCTGTGPVGQRDLLSVAEEKLLSPVQPFSHLPDPRARTLQISHPQLE